MRGTRRQLARLRYGVKLGQGLAREDGSTNFKFAMLNLVESVHHWEVSMAARAVFLRELQRQGRRAAK